MKKEYRIIHKGPFYFVEEKKKIFWGLFSFWETVDFFSQSKDARSLYKKLTEEK